MAKNEASNKSLKAKDRMIRIIALAGVFIALEFVTEYYLSITFGTSWRVALTFLIRAIAGFALGCIGGLIAGITDILGAFIFYGGSMIPGITVIRFLQGLIAGLILYKKLNTKNVAASAVICTFVLNVICIKVRFDYTGTPLTFATAAPSATIYAISCITEIVIMLLFREKYAGNIKRLLYSAGIWSAPKEAGDKTVPATDDAVSAETVDDATVIESVPGRVKDVVPAENVACDPQKAV